MGFLCVDIEVPKLLAGLLNLLAHLKLMLMVALFQLGLINPPDQFHTSQYSLSSSSSSLGVPLTIIKSPVMLDKIKKRLPILEYGEFLDKSSSGVVVCHDDEVVCAVCLSLLETRHEIRELSNCCHVFHRECLDKWVDESQLTCPLCRAKLLPIIQSDEIMMMRGGSDPWMVDRISYLFGEDF